MVRQRLAAVGRVAILTRLRWVHRWRLVRHGVLLARDVLWLAILARVSHLVLVHILIDNLVLTWILEGASSIEKILGLTARLVL